jgi:hypothetical protein
VTLSAPAPSFRPSLGVPTWLFDDPRFHESAKDRSEPPFYKYREYSAGEAEIVGRDGSLYSSQYSGRNESWDLFDHNAKRFICEEGVKDIDEAIDILNEKRWRAEAHS